VPSAIGTPQVEIIAQGFYFDELTAQLSTSQITLRAIADLSINSSPTDFVRDFVGPWYRIGVHLIRVIAWTPSGTQCSAFLEPSLKQWLVAKAASMQGAGQAGQ
jgi:hypothetical protein